MTNEEKELLLKDLSARLPYGVKVSYTRLNINKQNIFILKGLPTPFHLDIKRDSADYYRFSAVPIEDIKPYLRPISSMTEDEKLHIVDLGFMIERRDNFNIAYYDFLNSIHIDYRGLIGKGIAIKAPEKMYKEYRLPPLGSNWWEMYNSINLKNE